MKVDLFIPCFIDQLYPETAFSVVSVLESAGVEVLYNPGQTCCGQPAFNSGYWKDARKLAVKFLSDFSDAKVIVSPSASCTGYIRNYYHQLLIDDKILADRFEQLRPSICELSDFLVNIIDFTDFNVEFPHRVTYHDACHALREYGIRQEPRTLLGKVKGLELIEMKDTEICCGFGGTFAAKFHHISTAMTEQKVENALATGAEYIISTEASCLMNMESYIRKQKLPVKTAHLADILAGKIKS
jgi:L-lactate dehydrogenase complex protein LldE